LIVSIVMKLRTLTLACGLAAAAYSGAYAQTPAPPPETAAAAAGVDQATLPKGRAVIDAYLEINLSSGAAFKPFSISPDIWYGATDDVTVGLVHSTAGQTGFIGGVGDSLCITGTNNGCAKFYDNVGVDIRYKLKPGTFSWAFAGGLYFESFDPTQLALKLGAVGRWHKDKIAFELQPALFFGLTNRSIDTTVGGVTVTTTVNGDILSLPLTGFYALTPKISAALQTGLILPFEDTSDAYVVPLSVGVHFLATEHFNANLSFTFLRLIAGSGGGADARSLTIGGSYAL
jgi:hypothetical protein